jgi:predicted small lipoprotein YifL
VKRTTAIGMLLLVLVLAAGCGRYGPPVRAEEYRAADKAKEQARQEENKKNKSERNEPLPPSP